MNIELKNIKHSEFASHETDCFQASLWVDGKRFAFVWNDGQGGPNSYDREEGVIYSDMVKVENYCKSLPKIEFMDSFIEQDLDMVCWELLENWRIAKDIKRYTKTKIAFMKPNDKSIWTTTVADKKPNTHLAQFMEKNPTFLVLNAHPIAEAVERAKAWA